jgi:tetratricopeptide (TPR) repeat protein
MSTLRPEELRPGARRWKWLLALLAALPLWGAAPATAADEFYLNLLRTGSRAMSDNDPGRARFHLQIACFGLLEEPVILSQCLVRLGLAESALGDATAFRQTFDRLVDVERLFPGSFEQADLPPALRDDFEAEVAHWIAESRLVTVPAFQELAIRSAANRLARMPAGERREALERLIAEAPDVSRWRLMLGDIYLEERQYEAAIGHAEAVLAAEPDNPRARCLYALSLASSGRCTEAVADLVFCQAARSDRPTAATVLSCQTSAGRWADAGRFFEELPADLQETRQLRRYGREIERNLASEAVSEPTGAGLPAAGAEADGTTPAAQPSPTLPARPNAEPAVTVPEPATAPATVELSPQDQLDVARARELAATARYKEEVAKALELVLRVADDNPLHTDTQALAGELAYRAQRWSEVIEYLRRMGPSLRDDHVLVFYLSVAYFESGQIEEARRAFNQCCSDPDPSPVIESYRAKILGN